ncbi:MAG TPA: RNA polymerase sigma factor [Acidimicrobiales bacterium]|nr:RNA polymerase sigma factor [Acidimicrobiales bacterium]
MALRQDELTSLCDDVDLDRDRALVERCQAGDSAAFGNLYARYYERLLRFCLRRLNDRHEAEDAAQEAFARAWKALPRFAGERRFYPWLTVIAGNICTDMLRRRSRSTPTEDMELTAQHPVGVVGEDTSEELVLAAVDGELVHRALDRLSTRHRHVLAMREGSGWTYQQIADHEGVEIGTIETLLWRARQALKREFAVVSESKDALAGFLVATGVLFRRTIFRLAHRGATVQHQGNGTGGLRNAVAGVAVTGAAVAAAFIAPHALSGGPSQPVPGSAGSGLAAPAFALGGTARAAAATVAPGATSTAGGSNLGGSSGSSAAGATGTGSAAGGSAGRSGPLLGGTLPAGSSGGGGTGGLAGGLNQAAGGLGNTVNGVAGGLGNTVNGVTGGLGNTVNGVTGGVTGSLNNTVNGVTGALNNTVNGLGLGGLLGGTTGAGTSTGTGGTGAPAASTTTSTTSLLGGLGHTVNSLLGGG